MNTRKNATLARFVSAIVLAAIGCGDSESTGGSGGAGGAGGTGGATESGGGGAGGSVAAAIPEDAGFTIDNTLETAAPVEMGGTGGQELPIEVVLGAPKGSLTGTGTVSYADVELTNYLMLWDVDFSANSITFTSTVDCDAPPFPGFCRILEPGTFDRYYLSFEPALSFATITTSDPSIVAEVRGEALVIEIGPGRDTSAAGFTVQFE
jgi:hypothetical protein